MRSASYLAVWKSFVSLLQPVQRLNPPIMSCRPANIISPYYGSLRVVARCVLCATWLSTEGTGPIVLENSKRMYRLGRFCILLGGAHTAVRRSMTATTMLSTHLMLHMPILCIFANMVLQQRKRSTRRKTRPMQNARRDEGEIRKRNTSGSGK